MFVCSLTATFGLIEGEEREVELGTNLNCDSRQMSIVHGTKSFTRNL